MTARFISDTPPPPPEGGLITKVRSRDGAFESPPPGDLGGSKLNRHLFSEIPSNKIHYTLCRIIANIHIKEINIIDMIVALA